MNGNHYLGVKLVGSGRNTGGIGAKVEIYQAQDCPDARGIADARLSLLSRSAAPLRTWRLAEDRFTHRHLAESPVSDAYQCRGRSGDHARREGRDGELLVSTSAGRSVFVSCRRGAVTVYRRDVKDGRQLQARGEPFLRLHPRAVDAASVVDGGAGACGGRCQRRRTRRHLRRRCEVAAGNDLPSVERRHIPRRAFNRQSRRTASRRTSTRSSSTRMATATRTCSW